MLISFYENFLFFLLRGLRFRCRGLFYHSPGMTRAEHELMYYYSRNQFRVFGPEFIYGRYVRNLVEGDDLVELLVILYLFYLIMGRTPGIFVHT